ncbi:MAG TPA: hypothetical protein VMZ00_04080, partial [Sporichthya sp.]|nr:hypothetical protein [Sporichthya sp.]
MTVPNRPPTASPTGARKLGMLPILGAFFLVLVGLDLLITGLGSPPSNVPPVQLGENTGVPMVPSNA